MEVIGCIVLTYRWPINDLTVWDQVGGV